MHYSDSLLAKLADEELMSVVLSINDDLQKTFSRYKDLKDRRMPEEYTSAFEFERAPAPKPQSSYKPSAVKAQPVYNPPVAPPPPQREEYVPVSAPADSEPEPKPAPAPRKAPAKKQAPPPAAPEAKKAAPAPIPAAVFDLFSNNEEPKKSDLEGVFDQPIKPMSKDKEEQAKKTVDSSTTGKLNDIMKQLEISDEHQKKEEEARKQQMDAAFNQPQFPMMPNPMMMNPQMMQYMTNMAAFNPMGAYRPAPSPYMTNMNYPGMMPMMRPPMPRPVNILCNNAYCR